MWRLVCLGLGSRWRGERVSLRIYNHKPPFQEFGAQILITCVVFKPLIQEFRLVPLLVLPAVPIRRKMHIVSRIMYLKPEDQGIPTELSEHQLTAKNSQIHERPGFMSILNRKSDLKIFSMEFRRWKDGKCEKVVMEYGRYREDALHISLEVWKI